MSLKKQYIKEKPVCKVTFKLPQDVVSPANKVNLTGDFNNWDVESLAMKKTRTGDYSVSLELEKGKEYQFKYVLDGKKWMNEAEADKFVPNEFQTENSVVIV